MDESVAYPEIRLGGAVGPFVAKSPIDFKIF